MLKKYFLTNKYKTMEQISLTIEDLKLRDKIEKKLSSIEIISIYKDIEGILKINMSNFNIKYNSIQLEKIINSLSYKYNVINETFGFKINGIIVNLILD